MAESKKNSPWEYPRAGSMCRTLQINQVQGLRDAENHLPVLRIVAKKGALAIAMEADADNSPLLADLRDATAAKPHAPGLEA